MCGMMKGGLVGKLLCNNIDGFSGRDVINHVSTGKCLRSKMQFNMLNKFMFFILFIAVFANDVNAQTTNNLKEINEVWYQFYQTFDSLDYQPMAAIHSKNLIRIAGGKRISDYETYINNYKKRFVEQKKKGETNEISLRFFERISNDSIASERGVYKLVRNKNRHDERAYYGQFHVILMKENDTWKIFMDYDSNESNSIGEDDYAKAYGIENIDKFVPE